MECKVAEAARLWQVRKCNQNTQDIYT